MIALVSLRWALTVPFTGAGVFHLVRNLRPQPAEHRISEALHFTMCVAMIVMVWPWGARMPPAIWVTVFTLSTGWFVASAAWSPGRRLGPSFSAATAVAMVWMRVSMPAQAAPGHGRSAMAMPGMSHSPTGNTAWMSAGLGLAMVAIAAWWVGRGMRLTVPAASAEPDAPNWPALCHGLMSAGMGLALLAMA